MKLFNKRTTALLGLTVFLMAFVAVYTSRLSQRGKAAQPKVNFTFTPTGGNFGVGEEKSLDVVIQPEDGTKKISGVDITFVAEGSAVISQAGAPASFPGNDTSLFTEVVKDVTNQKAHLSYVSLKPEAQLPGAVKLQLSFKGTAVGGGKIRIDSAVTQIVGNIAGNSYDLGSAGEGSFNFSGIANVTLFPTPTAASTPSASPLPTPPSGDDKYTVDIGDKQWLTINVGAGQIAQIRFKAKLSRVYKTPELYLKLRTKDELAFMNTIDGQSNKDTCNNTPSGSYDFWVPVKADKDGIYTPNSTPSSTLQTPSNAFVPPISSDGWVMLPGITGGKYYSFFLKGPKTRSTKMAEHIQLVANEKQNSQDFDWTGKTLDPGDLPDPNRSLRQDCTVNSIDISLISSRLAKTDANNLNIADVNYDGVIQGSDIASVVVTLSTKPDDDQ